MTLNLRRFDSVAQLTRGVAEAIVRQVEGRGARVIALSGGGTPPPAYELLGRGELRERLAGREIVWVIGDERFVPDSDPQSNVGMVKRTLFAQGISPKHALLDFRTSVGEPPEVAADFERRWRELAIERIDCNVLGMGDDGHTASLFPGSDALEVSDQIATAVYVPKVSMWRLTMTMPVIQQSAVRFMMVAGESKREMLGRAAAGEDLPVVRATQGEGETWWFVDRAAAPEV